MKRLIFISFAIFLTFVSTNQLLADEDNLPKKLTVSGHIKDQKTGEDLIGATIYISEIGKGTVTDIYGNYSINLKPGTYTFKFSYVGYAQIIKTIEVKSNVKFDLSLKTSEKVLEEVVVSAQKANKNITQTEMSSIKMNVAEIRKIPALMGEVDVLKAVQLLPGVSVASEGSNGFSVRGGATDQNLILLDDATVYNASHLMGFFSVFNNDAVKDVKLYKGDIPASEGGRLSSLLDIQMRDGDDQKFGVTGGIGIISSRLTVEGPVLKGNTSFLLSGRRTYADMFLPLAKNPDIRENKLYFYDLNGKITHKINNNNRLYFSAYHGRDVFKNQFASMGFGNSTLSLRWNHIYNNKLFSNLTLLKTDYDYSLGTPEGDANAFEWTSKLHDYALKLDYHFALNPNNKIRFGASSILHNFEPGSAKGLGDESLITSYVVPKNKSLEHAVFVSNEQKFGSRLTLKYGIRFSAFQNISGTYYTFDQKYNTIDSNTYSNEFFNTYYGLEPRVGATYLINESSSVKASYSKTRQYVQLAQNSTAGTPLDVWFSASPNVKPQIADQIAIGYFQNFWSNRIEASVETYYKKMNNVIDFKDHASLLLNQKMEAELRYGDAYSYGMEFMVKLNGEKLNGWISYTLSKTEREVPEINGGKPYLAPYDKTHDLSLIATYDIHKRHSVSINWVYSTGNPVTLPSGKFQYGGVTAPVYTDRNAYRMPDYHRLDVAYIFKAKQKENRKFDWDLNVSCYNIYGRKNAWAINFEPDEENPGQQKAVKTYLFAQVPSATFNFKF